jgi:hypothetical protein
MKTLVFSDIHGNALALGTMLEDVRGESFDQIEIVTWGNSLGCEEVWLGTEIDNTAARALYVRYAEAQEIVMYSWELEREGAE